MDKAKAKRGQTKVVGLLPAHAKVLGQLVDGVRLYGRRTYPHPLRYSVQVPGRAPDAVPATLVVALVEAGAVVPLPLDEWKDEVEYRLTDKGRDIWARGALYPPDHSQEDMFPQAVV